jgi:hypothetical protein
MIAYSIYKPDAAIFIRRGAISIGADAMEQEFGRIRKSDTTELVVRRTEFRGSVGIDIREFVTSERYTGWSKNGIRIPVEQWRSFREILDKIEVPEGGEGD